MPDFHDKRYRYLFSHPLFVQRLLTSFVDQPFVQHLDFSTLERVNASFVSPDFERRESDIIWKIAFQGKPVYIFLLMEFQSSPDRWMPLRFCRYIVELYELIIHRSNAPSVLPAVFPLLLYNGDAPWNVSETVEALIEPSIPEKFIPHLSYYPLIINAIPTEQLERIQNAVSAVFFVENSSPADLIVQLDTNVDILQTEVPEVIERFSNWFNNFLETRGMFEPEQFFPITTATEVRMMFATKLEAYEKQLKEKGREEGLERGRGEGKAALLARQLNRRFGLSPDEMAEVRECRDTNRIESAADLLFEPDVTKEQILRLLSKGDVP